MNFDSCKMTRVADEGAVRSGKPGDYCVTTITDGELSYKRLYVHLPHGEAVGINLDGENVPGHLPAVWAWNGDENKPTLKRPIRLRGRWCGQMKNGRLIGDPEPSVIDTPKEMPLPAPPVTPIAAAVKRAARSKKNQ